MVLAKQHEAIQNRFNVTVTTVLVLAFTSLLPGSNGYAGDNARPQDKWNPEWYLRLSITVPSEGLLDKGNVLGQLNDSIDDQDSHDLIELDPAFTPYLTLVFPHEDWPQPGHYASDFHDRDYTDSDQWVFMVKSDGRYRDITLYWDSVKVIERIA